MAFVGVTNAAGRLAATKANKNKMNRSPSAFAKTLLLGKLVVGLKNMETGWMVAEKVSTMSGC